MKKRILTIALAVALLATCFGGTYAYLKDTHVVKNTFATGNVYITLDEAKVKLDETTGNLIKDGNERISTSKADHEVEQNYHLFPDMVVTKDPTIHVDDTSEDAWIAAIITISGTTVDMREHISGGILESNKVTVVESVDGSTRTLYVYVNEKVAKTANEKDIVLFETLTIPAAWGNSEMDAIDGMTIDVTAYAVQSNGFDTCVTAMQTAYGNVFPTSQNP